MAEISEKIKKGLREFGLTSFAVDNRTTIFLLTFMIVIFGVVSYNRMPKESFPEIDWPEIYINTTYFGNSAEDIENLITRPLEKELGTIAEIKKLKSSSLQDFSIITAEFNADIEMDAAVRKVKDAVDRAKSELPNDLEDDPEVLEINLSEIPIMSVNISGDYSNDQLRKYAEYLEDEIEELDEILKVDLKGALEREMKIEVDLLKMQSMEVSFSDIENAVKSENLNMSGGEVLNNEFRSSIRVLGEFDDATELQNMIVKNENNAPIYLRDIAKVSFGEKEKSSIARADRLPVISLDIIKRGGENLLDASDKIKAAVEEAQKKVFPDDIKVSIFNDQSIQTRNLVSNLENSIISGMILVVMVLLFFLGIRNSLFVGLAIPMSMLIGYLILNIIGYSMNMMVLFSLILALGMLVDNAIVVVENTYRYMQRGYTALQAARYGTGEIAVPIISSTATTLAAFVPLAFWPGIMGSFMKYMPITLIIVLSSSLFVALVITPVFTAKYMKVDENVEDPVVRKRKFRNVMIAAAFMFLIALTGHFSGTMWVRNLFGVIFLITLLNVFFLRGASFWFQREVLPRMEYAYDWFIKKSLNRYNPLVLFAGVFVLLIVAFVLLVNNSPKVELFPETDPLYVNAFVELPMGKDIESTNRLLKEIELKVEEVMKPYAKITEAMLSQIGENTSDPNAGPSFGASPNKARLTVTYIPSDQRGELSTVDAMEAIRDAVKGYAGVKIVVDREQSGPPQGKPINIELRGDEIDTLAILSENLIAFINSKNIGGIEELKADVSIGKPEILVHIDRQAARTFQISTYNIADALRTSVFGKEISKFKQGEDEYPINLRLLDEYRYNKENLLNQKITFRSAADGKISQVPISTVANLTYSSTYSSINRKDQERMITIYSNVLDGYNANEIVTELKSLMEEYELPTNYTVTFTGEQEEMAEQMEFLSLAFSIAIFMIFLIMVAQFNSIISPFIIIISVLFSTIGVFLGYVVNDMGIEIVMTGLGVISLAGIVVNNAIVLVDYTNLLIERKMQEHGYNDISQLSREEIKEAIVAGGATRLRPVLLTAITTVLGLIPMAIGFNFNFFTFISDLDPQFFVGGDNAIFWGTLSWTVIYGLTFSTFLTLVVVPVMYWLFYRLNIKVKTLF